MHRLHVVDAFTHRPFRGNPAAVCLLDEPADEGWMKNVAREMNLSETAFLHPIEGGYALRWFTPAAEVKLCGHATLASAAVLWRTGVLPTETAARFHTLSGWLTCRCEGDWIAMDFPLRVAEPCPAPDGLAAALGCELRFCGANGTDFLVEVANEAVLRGLRPDFRAVMQLPVRGVIVTCRGESADYDFISRFFAPAVGVNEDPVTGSAHCALAAHWAAKLGRTALTGFQASARGGFVRVEPRGDRVLLRGQAVIMSEVRLLA